MNMLLNRRGALALALAGLASRAFGAGAAADIAHLSFVVGTDPGTTGDTVARTFADAAKSVRPGLVIDIENQGGAGGKLAFEAVLNAAGDREKLGFLQGSLLYHALSSEPAVADQFSSFALLGSIGVDRRALFVTPGTGIASFADLLASDLPLIAPTTSAAGSGYIETLLVNALTGSKLKAVAGYGSAERKLALLSGEGNAVVGSIDTFADLVDQGALRPVLRLNDAGPAAPHADLPLLASVAKGPDAALLVELIEAISSAGSIVAAPSGLAPADIEALAALFAEAAPSLEGKTDAGVGAAELQPRDRQAVLATVGDVLDRRETIGAAFLRAQACGQSLSDGKACS